VNTLSWFFIPNVFSKKQGSIMEPTSFTNFPGPFKKAAAVLTLLALAALPGFAQPNNTILLETWTGITGAAVSNLTSNANYPGTPGTRTYPTLYEQPATGATDLGTRTRAFITPPATGVYNFFIACDDACELWFSTTDNFSGRTLIASTTQFTNSREWTKYPSQKSANITLNKGSRYYIETLHKQGSGGGNLAVGWQGPFITGDAERPIPGSRLMPYQLIAVPAITTQPANITVTVGQTAAFTVGASGTGLSYQWRNAGVSITDATSATYTTPPTVAEDNGSFISVKVSNGAGSATSAGATLTVNSGNTAPTITTQPANITVTQYNTATFTVTASGSPAPSYQWHRVDLGGVDTPVGGNTSSYTVPAGNTPPSENGARFYVVVSNGIGSPATSSHAALTVNFPPYYITQPQTVTASVGQTATFTMAYAANPAPTPSQVKWRKKPFGTSSWVDLGVTGLTYTTPALTQANDKDSISVVVDNALGSASSISVAVNIALKIFYADTLKAKKVVTDTLVAKVVVATPKWRVASSLPDYVFDPGYKLNTLEETEAYTKVNRHLPNLPSAKEMSEKGVNLMDMNMQLLKTVEEMTLHMIEMDKELKSLKSAPEIKSR
jgi:GLEYA domain-containing protein